MNNKANLFWAVLVSAALSPYCLGQSMYTVAPVPGPAPTATTYNNATWISDDGTVVFGAVYDNSIKNGQGQAISQCYISTNGNVQVYSTPGYSCTASGPGGANNNGQFAGVLTGVQLVRSVPTAFSNLDGSFTSLAPQLPFGASNALLGSWSTGIDQNGNVVGYAVGLDPNAIDGASQYGFLINSQTVQLPMDKAASINDHGLIGGDTVITGVPTGAYGVPGRQPRVASLYSKGNLVRLGTLGGAATSTDGPESSVTAVNNNGQAVGWSTLIPENFNNPSSLIDEAFFWDGNSMHAIQIQNGGNLLASIANSLNDAGEVVGYFYTTPISGLGSYSSLSGAHAFYYSNDQAADLNTLLVNPPQGLVLATATYVNNKGQILATALMPDGSEPTYLLTPVSPSSSRGDPAKRPDPRR
jgi:hypothetical protein